MMRDFCVVLSLFLTRLPFGEAVNQDELTGLARAAGETAASWFVDRVINADSGSSEVADLLRDFAEARQNARKFENCPCAPTPDGTACVSYDPRLQASSIEAAILNFPDLTIAADEDGTLQDATVAKIGRKHIQEGTAAQRCGRSSNCRNCGAALIERLQQKGFLKRVRGFDQVAEVTRRLGINVTELKGGNRHSCSRYRQWQRSDARRPQAQYKDRCLADLKPIKGRQPTTPGRRTNPRPTPSSRSGGRRRAKRQASIGSQWIINCVRRGEPEKSSQDQWLVMCNMCWAWRILPSNYFPRYVNELTCDSDSSCLKGFGQCHTRVKNINILQNFGTTETPNWQSTTLSSSTCCDCKVLSGSRLHAFIAE